MTIKQEIEKFIDENKDLENAVFEKNIVRTNYQVFGVKTPILDKFARNLAKKVENLQEMPKENYEEVMLVGMTMCYKKTNNEEKIKDLKYFLPLIDCWGICDSIVPRLKGLEKKKDFFIELTKDKRTFFVRFAIVWLMRYNLKANLKETVEIVKRIDRNEYYIQMAKAWLMAEAFIYDFDYMIKVVSEEKDNFVQKKAITKAIESFRITKEQKQILKDLREKLKK